MEKVVNEEKKRPETREDEKEDKELRRVSVDNKWEGKGPSILQVPESASYLASSGLAAADDSAGITQLSPAGPAGLACAKIP